MVAPSIQFNSVIEAFGQNGWHHDLVEGREVLQTQFEAHHTRIHVLAQAFTNLNALAIVGETPLAPPQSHLSRLSGIGDARQQDAHPRRIRI